MTAIAGALTVGQRSAPLRMPDAILGPPPRQDLCHLGRAPLGDRPVEQGGRAGAGRGFGGVRRRCGCPTALFDALPATDRWPARSSPGRARRSPLGPRPGRGGRVRCCRCTTCSSPASRNVLRGVTQWGATDFAVCGLAAAQRELVRRHAPGGGRPTGWRRCRWSTACRCSYYPPTRLHLVDTSGQRHHVSGVVEGATDGPRRSRCCPGRDCRPDRNADHADAALVKDVGRDPGRGGGRSGLRRTGPRRTW